MLDYEKRNFNIPLIFIIGFNLFTLIAFLVAPNDWSRGNPELVTLYLILNYIFISFGYFKGVKRGKRRILKSNVILLKLNNRIISIVFIFYFFTFLIKYAYLLRFNILDVSGMISYLAIGIIDPRAGYYLSLYDTRPFTVSWTLFTFISVFNQFYFIFGFISWKRLNKFFKIMFVIFILIEIFYWFGRGTGFGIISLITILASSYLVEKKINKINFKSIGLFLMLGLSGIIFFGFLKTLRAGGEVIDYQNFNQGFATVNENHFIFKVIPESLTQTYLHSNSYLTQGYYHLGLSMNSSLPFTSTYFFGSNPAILNIANTFGTDLWDNTYMKKLEIEEGVDALGKWHSGYLWFANDVSLFGVPIILMLIGYFLGLTYSISIVNNDLLSKLIFVLLFNMLLYLFANNTFMSQHFYSLTVFIPIWYFTRLFGYK